MNSPNYFPWLPTQRTCACSAKSQNCLSERAWLRNQVPIWYFSSKELNTKFDTFSHKQHPAVFPSALAKRLINNYTHENETVLDIFSGVGTTLYAAQVTRRNGIGIELNKYFSDFTVRRLKLNNADNDHSSTPEITHKKTSKGQNIAQINSDNSEILKYFPPGSIDLVITSPPYWDLLKQPPSKRNLKNQRFLKENYSKDPGDLSNDRSLDVFFGNIKNIFSNVYQVLKPGARCVIDTADYRRKGEFIPLSSNYINIMQTLKFELKNIIIWDRRAEYDIGLFSYPYNFIVNNGMFEYLLEFKK
jgi:DNA modification methylase